MVSPALLLSPEALCSSQHGWLLFLVTSNFVLMFIPLSILKTHDCESMPGRRGMLGELEPGRLKPVIKLLGHAGTL
jgi:hypothetical protein